MTFRGDCSHEPGGRNSSRVCYRRSPRCREHGAGCPAPTSVAGPCRHGPRPRRRTPRDRHAQTRKRATASTARWQRERTCGGARGALRSLRRRGRGTPSLRSCRGREMSVQLDGRRPDRLVETSGRPAGGRVQAAIETSALTKAYGATVAVDRLDLRVEPGQCLAFSVRMAREAQSPWWPRSRQPAHSNDSTYASRALRQGPVSRSALLVRRYGPRSANWAGTGPAAPTWLSARAAPAAVARRSGSGR